MAKLCLELLSLSHMADFERDQMASHRFSASMEYLLANPLAPKQVCARAAFDHFIIALAARRTQSPPLLPFARLLSVLVLHSRCPLVAASGSLSHSSLATVHVLNSQRFHRSRLTPPRATASVRRRARFQNGRTPQASRTPPTSVLPNPVAGARAPTRALTSWTAPAFPS